jgi:hypothetical protein
MTNLAPKADLFQSPRLQDAEGKRGHSRTQSSQIPPVEPDSERQSGTAGHTGEGIPGTSEPITVLNESQTPADRGRKLTTPQRDLLWLMAQHIYGWTHVQKYGGQQQVAKALERRGLAGIDWTRTCPTISLTELGADEVERRWPVSPFVLHTYAHQPNGWTPKEGLIA